MFQTVHLLKHCQIEDTMKKLYTWLCANKLTLNVTKTNYCIFRGKQTLRKDDINEINFGHNSIKRVEHVRYLGMYIDEKLSWKYHVYNILKQLSKTSSSFKFIRNHVPHQCKKQLYYSFVHSKIIYGIEVYGNTNKSLLTKLQVIQNKILKILYKKDWYLSTNTLHKEINILKVNDLYNMSVLKFVHKCKINDSPNIFNEYYTERHTIHNYNTRYAKTIDLPKFNKITYGKKSIRYIGAQFYNNITTKIKNVPDMNVKEFSNFLKDWYIDQY